MSTIIEHVYVMHDYPYASKICARCESDVHLPCLFAVLHTMYPPCVLIICIYHVYQVYVYHAQCIMCLYHVLEPCACTLCLYHVPVPCVTTYRWVGEGICWEVTLAAVELWPQDASLVCVTCLEAAAGAPHTTATNAQLIKVHQQLKVW